MLGGRHCAKSNLFHHLFTNKQCAKYLIGGRSQSGQLESVFARVVFRGQCESLPLLLTDFLSKTAIRDLLMNGELRPLELMLKSVEKLHCFVYCNLDSGRALPSYLPFFFSALAH